MGQNKSLFASFFVILGLIALGIVIGMFVPRVSLVDTGSSPSDAPAATGVHVEKLSTVEEMFSLVGQNAVVLKYSGGDVQFWLELERDGEKQRYEPIKLEPPVTLEANQSLEGHFIWVRSEPDDEGREVWALGFRRDIVSKNSSAVSVSSPLAHASASRTDEDRQKKSSWHRVQVLVWKVMAGSKMGSGSGHIPTPLPTNCEVCLMEAREGTSEPKAPEDLGADGGTANTETNAKQPPADQTQKNASDHIIRVMCKVVSSEDKANEVANGK